MNIAVKRSKLKMIHSCEFRIALKKKKELKEKRDLVKGLVEIPWKTVKGVKGSPKAQLNQENSEETKL